MGVDECRWWPIEIDAPNSFLNLLEDHDLNDVAENASPLTESSSYGDADTESDEWCDRSKHT